MKVPQNLSDWQKKYGPGFVLYSLQKGSVLASGATISEMYKKIKEKKVKEGKDTSVMYLPPYKGACVF